MKKTKITALILAFMMSFALLISGCSLITSDSEKDLVQVVATVNIAAADNFEEDEKDLAPYAEAVGETEILKSKLISYFLNVGYSYVQSGMSYSSVFTTLIDTLIENAVVVQYAKMYLLDKKAEEEYNGSAEAVMAAYTAFDSDSEKLEFLLGSKNVGTSSVEYSDEVYLAKYNLMYTINSSVDSYELQLLEAEDSNAGTSTLTTPGNVDTEKEDYYPANADGSLNYNVYTGYTGDTYNYSLSNSGEYISDRETTFKGYTPENSKMRRASAYNSFISTLIANGLVNEKEEDVRDVMSLQYVQDEYIEQLEAVVLEKYYDLYEEEQEEKLIADDYAYVKEVYADLYSAQEASYSDTDSFTTALGSMSDTSFVLYSPASDDSSKYYDGSFGGTYGFIYNILLPYSEEQQVRLSEYQTDYLDDDGESYTVDYYNKRNELLKAITTTDQRDVWFNGSTDYSFNAANSGLTFYSVNSAYLFFENNLLNTDRYEKLDKYAGLYAFNGTVVENSDGTYNIIKNKLTIDDMLSEFKNYVDFIVGEGSVTFDPDYYNYQSHSSTSYKTSLTKSDLYKDYKEDSDKKTYEYEIDYSNFIYALGKVNVGNDSLSTQHANVSYNTDDNTLYKAMSAVNELQYAYTTDTGVLSQYLGYSVSLYDTTGYIKEFEYAAHKALEGGAGTFTVCAGDYGWHIIYVTFTFDVKGGAVYQPEWTEERIEQEGTFENLFYEWLKSNDIEDASSTRKSWIVTKYSIEDTTVVRYEDRYQNLLDLDD